MLSPVLRTIRRHELVAAGDKVLVAVSGGPDSMALLAALWELAARLRITLEVAAVDHGLRPEAADELALVAARAEALGLPFHPLRVDVPAAREPRGGGGNGNKTKRPGVQETARSLRQAALAELATRRECARVALGHQADDQTETIMFRVLRGTGLVGLAGMPYRRDPFVRPLLDVPRAQVLEYLRRRAIPHVADPSNADLRYTRARIRHRILPALRAENPRVDEALRLLAAAARSVPDGGEIDRIALAAEAGGIHIPRRLALEIAAGLNEPGPQRSFDLERGFRARVGGGGMTIEWRNPALARAAEAVGPAPEIAIPGPGMFPFPEGVRIGDARALVVRELAGPPPAGLGAGAGAVACFDADRVAWPLVLRTRSPGDRMRPRGGNGSRKLSDLLIDAKVPAAARAALPVVVDGTGAVLYVPGLRPSQAASPSSDTRRTLALALAGAESGD